MELGFSICNCYSLLKGHWCFRLKRLLGLGRRNMLEAPYSLANHFSRRACPAQTMPRYAFLVPGAALADLGDFHGGQFATKKTPSSLQSALCHPPLLFPQRLIPWLLLGNHIQFGPSLRSLGCLPLNSTTQTRSSRRSLAPYNPVTQIATPSFQHFIRPTLISAFASV